MKGFEYEVSRQKVDVKAGTTTTVTVTLKRMVNLKAKGWYSGSNHVHMNYAGNLHNTIPNMFMMNAAEDADMISLQIANKDNRVLDYQNYVPGQAQHPLSTKDRVMHVGQEYRPPFYGHIAAPQPEGAPDLAVRHRLRRHRRRESLSVEYRHPPLRQGAGRHRCLRASILRHGRSGWTRIWAAPRRCPWTWRWRP